MRELQEKEYLYAEEKTFLEFYEDPNLRTSLYVQRLLAQLAQASRFVPTNAN